MQEYLWSMYKKTVYEWDKAYFATTLRARGARGCRAAGNARGGGRKRGGGSKPPPDGVCRHTTECRGWRVRDARGTPPPGFAGSPLGEGAVAHSPYPLCLPH